MKRILIADDERVVKHLLQITLERQGYEVASAANGEEALESIRENQPDALITDLTMPRMDGRQLCRKIHQDYPERSFLIMVMTSRTEREEKGWMKDIPNIEFIEKPLSPTQLVARLKEYFNNCGGGTGDLHE